ncbi:(R)-hydratase [Rhodobacter sphaeroides]|jgi:Acyl dehydratase|uniref:MaoC family protein n=3 Tax=Cereibacter TaxID=1653176 RepID=Q3J425_CERS4|nr:MULTISPECIES: MaoC family dehydratase [Cereibacter]ABN76091.1 MaoC domain protein dehydratase [Cereibacter sphaeroides ATCC 17029]EKX56923.1 Acyl dehydratase [Rhodobacter sp. AKP1]ABA78459.1 MaoC family protein [Cereibacter sphaeroides 2.4.1]ACM00487.1 MaoC domain protein dehydratase [Cereibacter sphaeroides KD131]AMJ46812.1 dehydratase [Cereibacter sphaeroides]
MLDNMPRGTICIEDLEIGMSRHLRKEVTDRDIELFAEVSTDRNPVHLDEDYARDTIFEGRIAHGMLTAGLISAVIGEQLPGHGTVYLGQSLKFLAPVRPGDTVLAEVTVTAIDHAKRRVTLETRCLVGNTTVLKGEALVLAPSRKFD